MYSVQELSKMYGCTRVTMYTKLKDTRIQEFLHKDDKGMKLQVEGLNVLNVVMGESNVNN